jgi:hypothetical protein
VEKTTHEELYDPYSSPNIIRVIKSWTMTWAGYVVYIGNRRDAYGVVGGGPQGKRPLTRSRSRWEDNNKMNLQEVGWGAWTGLIWLRIRVGVGSCKCGNKLSDSINWGGGGNFLTSLRLVSFSRSTGLYGVSE